MSTASYSHLTKEQLVELLLDRDRDTESNPHCKKYGLIWEDKPEQFEEDSIGRIPVLKRDSRKCISTNPTKPTHVLIQGDNYHALKVLTYTHERSVDVIYIDPPYNTGNKDFKYNDKFVDKEDGYRHSKWLSFMAKRLRLAKTLLKDTGAIFLSIDSNEQAALRLLCDEIFGEANFVGTVIYKKQGGGKADSKFLAENHEYILVYGKNTKYLEFNRTVAPTAHYKKIAADGRKYRLEGLGRASLSYSKSLDYAITGPNGESIVAGGDLAAWKARQNGKHAEKDWQWRVSEKEYQRRLAAGLIQFTKAKDGSTVIHEICYCPEEGEGGGMPFGDYFDEVTNRTATNELREMFDGNKVFSHPKPIALIKHLVSMPHTVNPVVLDFFAGSGTTGHAVAQLNAADGGERQCILVTNDEGEFKDSAGELLSGGICTNVTYPRLRKVMEGYTTSKGESVAGVGENLTFFNTEFVEDRALERHRRELSARSAEMLCLREACYVEEPGTDTRWRSFTDGKGKRLLVVSDEFAAPDLVPMLKADQRETVVYVFRFGDDEDPASEYGGKGLEHVTAKPVPDSLLALHRRIQKQEVKAV